MNSSATGDMAPDRPTPAIPRLSLSAQVFIALALGIAAGLFFGELTMPVQVVGSIFIGLLQMTVLPYILVSLIAGIGKLSYPEMRLLAFQGGRFVLLFWALALVMTIAFTATLPNWESAAFFSSSLVETPEQTDLVGLYIPSNPFFSLSSGIVPAIALFSVAIGLAVGVFGGLRFFFEVVVPQEYREYEKLVTMGLAVDRVEQRVVDMNSIEPLKLESGTRLAAIRNRGVLRVGYSKNALPFVYTNDADKLVGLEADMAHLLAGEMGVELEFIEVDNRAIGKRLDSGRIDIMMSGLLVTPARALELRFTSAHLNSTLSLVVRDHDRSRFDSNEKLRSQADIRIAAVNLPYYSRFVERYLPSANVVAIDSAREFFLPKADKFDALLFSAEAGSAWTLVYPQYSVVVPKPRTVTAPIALGLPRGAPLLYDYVETWLTLQRESGVLDQLRSYWILGEGGESREPRWSVIRDVLGWVD
jgi:ABC-type amino acid transport substrate-binding protein